MSKRCPSRLAAKHNLKKMSKYFKNLYKNYEITALLYRPAANNVPLALPNVLIVTLNGINHASEPNIL